MMPQNNLFLPDIMRREGQSITSTIFAKIAEPPTIQEKTSDKPKKRENTGQGQTEGLSQV